MKRFFRVAVIAVGTLLIVVAVGVLLFITQADTVAKGVIERALTQVTDVPANVDSVRILPLDQSIEIRGLTLLNPKPFKAGPAIRVERIRLRLDLKTWFSRTPTIRQILVQGADLRVRYRLGEGTNLGRLARRAGGDEAEPAPEEKAGTDENPGSEAGAASPEARAFMIKELRCENAKVSIGTNIIPLASVGTELASFTLADLGDKPITTGKITAIFLRTALKQTLSLNGILKPVMFLIRKELGNLPADESGASAEP